MDQDPLQLELPLEQPLTASELLDQLLEEHLLLLSLTDQSQQPERTEYRQP